MAKNDNLTDFLTDVANAIRDKKGTSDPINPQNFSDEIASIKSGGSSWTGHADAEGLKAIGWTDEDIAYYQEHGVNWNEEDDWVYKVSDENKALYGVLTLDNIYYHTEELVYLPKLNTSGVGSLNGAFSGCKKMLAIPFIDTAQCSNMRYMFEDCKMLRCVSPLNTSNVWTMEGMFRYCISIVHIPDMDYTSNNNLDYTFDHCYSLENLNLNGIHNTAQLYDTFYSCYALKNLNIVGLKSDLDLSTVEAISKPSLLHIIKNATPNTTKYITLVYDAYERLSEDPDVLAALANQPKITLEVSW